MRAMVLFVLKPLSGYNLRSTTMRNTIIDRHLRGRYAQEVFRAVRESGSLQGLPICVAPPLRLYVWDVSRFDGLGHSLRQHERVLGFLSTGLQRGHHEGSCMIRFGEFGLGGYF